MNQTELETKYNNLFEEGLEIAANLGLSTDEGEADSDAVEFATDFAKLHFTSVEWTALGVEVCDE